MSLFKRLSWSLVAVIAATLLLTGCLVFKFLTDTKHFDILVAMPSGGTFVICAHDGEIMHAHMPKLHSDRIVMHLADFSHFGGRYWPQAYGVSPQSISWSRIIVWAQLTFVLALSWLLVQYLRTRGRAATE